MIFQILPFYKIILPKPNKPKSLALLKNPKTSVVSSKKQQYHPATALKLEKLSPQVSGSDNAKVICKHNGSACWKSGRQRKGSGSLDGGISL